MTTHESRAVDDVSSNAVNQSATTAALNADIETLIAFKGNIENTRVKAIFESVIVILTLVRDEIKEEPFAELAKDCVQTCRMMKTVAEGTGVDYSVVDPGIKQVEDLERIIHGFESVVRARANPAHDSREHYPGSTEERLGVWRADISEILRTFGGDLGRGSVLEGGEINQYAHGSVDLGPSAPAPVMDIQFIESAPLAPTPIPFLDGNLGLVKDAAPPTLTGSGGIDRDSIGESGLPSPLPPDDTDHPSEPPLISDTYGQALQRLVSPSVPQDELPSIIETVVSNVSVASIVKYLKGNDAQTFVDIMDLAFDTFNFPPRIRRKCVKSLYKMCAGHTLLPRSLHFELHDDPIGVVVCHGGFADVSKHEHGGREVAVKVLRARSSDGSQGMANRFCKEVITWRALRHPNILPLLGVIMTEDRFAMVSEWMINGNIKQFVTAHRDANRFELLGDVARGLIYMHGQGMIHGDLKGANILIDHSGHARLADFGLLTIVSDTTNITPSNSLQGGTYRWMSPELFDPERFDLKDRRQTKLSDCYALGMVIYEVLSRRVPFYQHVDYAVVVKVINGERPARPRGEERMWFTDGIWSMLGRCWEPSPVNRPSVEDVLQCLEKDSGPPLVLDPVIQVSDAALQDEFPPATECNDSSFSALTSVSSLDQNISPDPAPPVLTGSSDTDGDSFGESGPPLPLPPDDTDRPLFSGLDGPASQRLSQGLSSRATILPPTEPETEEDSSDSSSGIFQERVEAILRRGTMFPPTEPETEEDSSDSSSGILQERVEAILRRGTMFPPTEPETEEDSSDLSSGILRERVEAIPQMSGEPLPPLPQPVPLHLDRPEEFSPIFQAASIPEIAPVPPPPLVPFMYHPAPRPPRSPSVGIGSSLHGPSTDGEDTRIGTYSPPPPDEVLAKIKDERRYRLMLQHEFHPSLTLPLWSPSTVAIGSVGYLRKPEGEFVTLFNAFDPPQTSDGVLGGMANLHGYGNIRKGDLRRDRRNRAQRSIDAFKSWYFSKLDPDNVNRRYSWNIRANRKAAFLVAESTKFEYFEDLSAPKKWFTANVDEILRSYAGGHSITKEDLLLVIGTLSVPDYALFVSHKNPDAQVHFDVFASHRKGQPWGRFTTSMELSSPTLGDSDHREESAIPFHYKTKVSETSAGPWHSLLLARLRFKPDSPTPTSL